MLPLGVLSCGTHFGLERQQMTHTAGDIENPAKGTIIDINSAFIGENKTSLQIQFRLQESCDGNSWPIADAMRASHRPALPLKGNRCQSGALILTFPQHREIHDPSDYSQASAYTHHR